MEPLKLPTRRFAATTTAYKQTDAALGFDIMARTALETYSSSYNNMPTSSYREFAVFFSKENYSKLYNMVIKIAKNKPDPNDLYECMMRAYSTILPRSDEMDPRREKFDKETIRSYVEEINKLVIVYIVPEVEEANKLWDHLAKYRHGPGEDFGKDDDLHFGYDTRTRYHASQYDATWLM
jgi:hypothetical protein